MALESGHDYLVWVGRENFIAFLGWKPKAPPPDTRWTITGTFTGKEDPVGFWLDVKSFEARDPHGQPIEGLAWGLKGDRERLIPWSFVITIQKVAGSVPGIVPLAKA